MVSHPYRAGGRVGGPSKPRPLAWASLFRPFGAQIGIRSIGTPRVQQKNVGHAQPKEKGSLQATDGLSIQNLKSKIQNYLGRRSQRKPIAIMLLLKPMLGGTRSAFDMWMVRHSKTKARSGRIKY